MHRMTAGRRGMEALPTATIASGSASRNLGAAFLGLLSEILLVKFRYLYMLSLGLVLIVVVLALPRGLAGLVRARRPGCGSPSPTL